MAMLGFRQPALAAFLCLAAALPADAGVFSVAPVRMFMGPRDRAVAVTIVNEGREPLVLHSELYQWSQRPDGSDVLEPTDEVVLAPPIVTLGPGQQQVVRLAILRAIDPARQLTYRVILREVPEATSAPGAPRVDFPMAIAMNLPIFVSPPTARRELQCTNVDRAGGNFRATCRNTGTAYAQVREAVLRRPAAELARFQGGVYVLPGVTGRLALKMSGSGAPPGPAELHVSFDDGQTQIYEVTVP